MRLYHEDYRYRVVDVLYAEAGYVSANEVFEFKTMKSAKACEARLLAKGRRVLFQTAKVTWMTPDEEAAEAATLPKAHE